jgi:integrase
LPPTTWYFLFDAYAFPDTRGGRISRQCVAQLVGEAAAVASGQLTDRGLPPQPRTTPHTLRRTYISIAPLANRFDRHHHRPHSRLNRTAADVARTWDDALGGPQIQVA